MKERAEIYQHAPDALAVHVTNAPRPAQTAEAIRRKCPSARVTRLGDFEVILAAPLADAPAFLTACKALRRRRVELTEEREALLAEQGRKSLQNFRRDNATEAVSRPKIDDLFADGS